MFYGYMSGMHAWWWLFWIVVIAVLLFYAWRRPDDRGDRPRETPHEVLKRRLASGEITSQDYEARKTLLDRDKA
jgi:putative membrane protein